VIHPDRDPETGSTTPVAISLVRHICNIQSEVSNQGGLISRGNQMPDLVSYLFGPGRHNEHVSQHLVAGYPTPFSPPNRQRGNPSPVSSGTSAMRPASWAGTAREKSVQRRMHCIAPLASFVALRGLWEDLILVV